MTAFAAEVLARLPTTHHDYPTLCIYEADALLRLGAIAKALERHQQALAIREGLATAEPERADYQRDLSISYDRLGDLMQALGQGEAARRYYEQGLAIVEALAEAAGPEHVDYQGVLVVALHRMADVEPKRGVEHLTRAAVILCRLHDAGRLFPEQERTLQDLEQRLRDMQS